LDEAAAKAGSANQAEGSIQPISLLDSPVQASPSPTATTATAKYCHYIFNLLSDLKPTISCYLISPSFATPSHLSWTHS
jgi:hypothetical protein